MPIDDTASFKASPRRSPISTRRARATALASLIAIAALGALASTSASGCVPTPFTFEETEGGGAGNGGSASTSGGEGGGSTGSSGSAAGGASSSASTGTAMDPCGAGQMCIEEVPAGWEAHALVMKAPEGGGKPSCPNPNETPDKLNADPKGQHACTPCGCSIVNAQCSAPEITCWYQDGACTGAGSVGYKAGTTACYSDASPPLADNLPGSCKLTASPFVLDGGQCMTSGGLIADNEPWNTEVRSCTLMKNGPCGAASVCVPSPGAGQQICIRKDGLDECPAGWTYKLTAYGDANDTRGCAGCGCNPIACNGGSYTVWDATGCDGVSANVVVDSMNCTSVPNILDFSSFSLSPVLGAPTQQGCFGGEPTGSLEPIDPVTFCCKNP